MVGLLPLFFSCRKRMYRLVDGTCYVETHKPSGPKKHRRPWTGAQRSRYWIRFEWQMQDTRQSQMGDQPTAFCPLGFGTVYRVLTCLS